MTPTTFSRISSLTAAACLIIGLAACSEASQPADPAAPVATESAPATTTATTTASPTTAAATTTSAPSRPSAGLDELVAVHGAQMHVHCAGHGDSTVLLIAGFTNDRGAFSSVEEELASSARVCSYDRYGTGTSDAPPTAQTFASQARDLHELLVTVDEGGPYVVVGHSFGGDVAITFASLFPSDVHGLLLLDAPPATWNSTICAVADDGSAGAASFVQACAMQSDPGNNVEGIAGPTAFRELAQITSLGDIPTIVDTAAQHGYAAGGMNSDTASQLEGVWSDGEVHWASLSSAAQLVTVDRTGHHIQSDRPDLVIAQVAELLGE